ncbi:MAG: T9SS type A sorting domain-containing protein [Flavobacteriales bacterium]
MIRSHTLAGSILLTAPLLSFGQPPNDACADALTVSCGTVTSGTTVGAALDALDACGTEITAPGVWYLLEGNDMQVRISTCLEHSYDTKLSVFTGPCEALQCLGGNDDIPGCDYGSEYGFHAESGTTYHILVHGYQEDTGTFDLVVECTDLPNDGCGSALPIACNSSVDGSTSFATVDTVEDCVTGIDAPGIWYTFSGVDATVLLSTCENFGYDTRINVYSGDCDALECVTGNDDVEGSLCSEVTFNATGSETFRILVQGYDGGTGDFTLSMSCQTCATPTAIAITPTDVAALVYWTSNNPGADFEVEYGLAGFVQGTGTFVTGFTGIDGPPLTIQGLQPSNAYQLYIRENCGEEGSSAIAGPFAFSTVGAPPPVNALCTGALPIGCGDDVEGDTSQGILAPGPTCGPANITAQGLWYSFVGTGEEVTLSTCTQASFDTKLSVFRNGCVAPICVAGNDDAPGCANNTSRTTFLTEPGTNYTVLVHGYQENAGPFTLSMSCAAACTPAITNEDCVSAGPVTVQPLNACVPLPATLECAYASPIENPECDPYAPVVDAWFVFNTGIATACSIALQPGTAEVLNAAVYADCGTLEYIACAMEVDAPLDLEGLAPGTDHYLRVWNGGGAAAGTFTICIEADLSTGITVPQATEVRLWPVPAVDVLHVSDFSGQVALLDPAGRIVHTARLTGRSMLNVRDLAPGAYVLRELTTGAVLGRFVKE